MQDKKIREQSGVIPFYQDTDELKVMLITPRWCADIWIFPKGNLAAGLTPAESAAEEAYEEAGVKGEVRSALIGQYHYEKYGRLYRVSMYLLEIEEILDDFPEVDDRNRTLVSLSTALDLLQNDALRGLLHTAWDMMKQNSQRGEGS